MNGPVTGYDLSKLTVLIVEKHAPMRSLLRQVLRELGVRRIVDAASPEKGFEEFNLLRPDLVLVDWCPEFDGIGLVKHIRTDTESCNPQAPIIMVSAFGETQRIYQAIDVGINEYLVKPVSPKLLYVRIVSVIENARPFVRSETYIGPCRRRHELPFAGKDRRRPGDMSEVLEATPTQSNPVAPREPALAPAKAA